MSRPRPCFPDRAPDSKRGWAFTAQLEVLVFTQNSMVRGVFPMGIAPAGMVTFAVVVLNDRAEPPPGTHPVTSGAASRGGAPASDASTTRIELSRASGLDASTMPASIAAPPAPAAPLAPAAPDIPAAPPVVSATTEPSFAPPPAPPPPTPAAVPSPPVPLPACAPNPVTGASGPARARPSALSTCRCGVAVGRIVLVLSRIVDAGAQAETAGRQRSGGRWARGRGF